MTNTYKTICKIISTAMFGSAVSYDKDTNWEVVFTEMKAQRIAGIVSEILPSLDMDTNIKKEWQKYVLQQRMFFEELTSAQNEVCEVIANIPYAIIKGTSAAMYYPISSQRNMGDIDILFDGGTEEARDRLIEKGYILNNVGGWRHIGVKKGRICVELHYRYDKTIVNDIATGAVNTAEKHRIGNYQFSSLPKLENGLILLSHTARHLQEGIGFRQVLDWMMFVADKEDIDWQQFNKISKEAGLYTFQCVITRMCMKYLGLPLMNNIKWYEEANDVLCDNLLRFICKKGNFGKREGGYSGQFASKNKFLYGIKRLQLGGTYRWKALIKHPWLKPFAWIYQSGRVAKEVLSKDNPIKEIKKDMKDAKSIEILMNELNLSIYDAKDG